MISTRNSSATGARAAVMLRSAACPEPATGTEASRGRAVRPLEPPAPCDVYKTLSQQRNESYGMLSERQAGRYLLYATWRLVKLVP